MTKTSQFTDFADAVEAAAATDRELYIDTPTISLGRTARVVNPTNLSVWGDGNGSQVIPTSAMVNKDWLWFGDVNGAGAENLFLQDFAFVPPAGCTAGFAVRMDKCGRTVINNVDVGGNSGATPNMAFGGFWFNGFDKIDTGRMNVYAKSRGFLINGLATGWGADFTMGSDVKIQNHKRTDFSDSIPDSVGVHLAGGQGGSYLGGNIIYCGIGVLIDRSITDVQNREIFLQDGLIVDSCLSDGIRAMPNSFGLIRGSGFWSCSHGRAGADGDGFGVEAPQLGNAVVQLVGPHIFNNRFDGIVVNGGYLALSAPVLRNNGRYDLHIPNTSVRGGADPMFFPVPPAKIRNNSTNFRLGTSY